MLIANALEVGLILQPRPHWKKILTIQKIQQQILKPFVWFELACIKLHPFKLASLVKSCKLGGTKLRKVFTFHSCLTQSASCHEF